MGYQTRYEITSIVGDINAFRKAFESNAYAKRDGYRWFGVGVASEDWKWYEHEQHIAEAMLEAKTTSLDLHGEGEEQSDVWDKQFRLVGNTVTVRKFQSRLVREELPSETQTYEAPEPDPADAQLARKARR